MLTFSNGPWSINAKGGRYNESRLFWELSTADAEDWSAAQIPGRFTSGVELRNDTPKRSSGDRYPNLAAALEALKKKGRRGVMNFIFPGQDHNKAIEQYNKIIIKFIRSSYLIKPTINNFVATKNESIWHPPKRISCATRLNEFHALSQTCKLSSYSITTLNCIDG